MAGAIPHRLRHRATATLRSAIDAAGGVTEGPAMHARLDNKTLNLVGLGVLIAIAVAHSLIKAGFSPTAVGKDEARALARDAYIYGLPLVDSYRLQYSYFV